MGIRKFTLFHLSLVPMSQSDIETFAISKEDWIRRSLETGATFAHRGDKELHWVPLSAERDCILGLLQLQKPHEHHKPPSEGGGEIVSEEWQGAYVLVDPTSHDKGQRVAVENDMVGRPSALLGSLVRHINSSPNRPYQVEADQIFNSEDFWKFSRENGNVLRSVTFDFAVPNMWDATGGVDRDLRRTGQQTGAERVKVRMTSSSGITTDSDIIRDGVEYSERGAGKITAKSRDGKSYSSNNNPSVTEIPLTEGSVSEKSNYIKGAKNQVLGYGENSSVDWTDSSDNNTNDS